MAATTITSQSVTDDDGTGTTGTIWNAAFHAQLETNINALFSSTTGITLNQAGGDGFIFSVESSDVAHGVTAVFGTAVYGALRKYSATEGGLTITCATEGNVAFNIEGIATTGDTTKSTAGVAANVIRGYAKSGTSVADMGGNANILAVVNNATTRFILDTDGDSHQDVGTAWTNFDDFDDVGVLHALAAGISQEGDPFKASFAAYLARHRGDLERGRFVTFNEDGHHFINWSRTSMLMIGAVRQLGMRLEALESRLALAGGHDGAALEG